MERRAQSDVQDPSVDLGALAIPNERPLEIRLDINFNSVQHGIGANTTNHPSIEPSHPQGSLLMPTEEDLSTSVGNSHLPNHTEGHQNDTGSDNQWHAFTEEQLDLAVKLNPCLWLGRADLAVIGSLGFPDPFYWPSLQDWTEQLVERFFSHVQIDMRQIRQRFIRVKCVACGQVCQDGSSMDGVDVPVALPCGHIIGIGCLSKRFHECKTGEDLANMTCPWDGPAGDEPTAWSQPCNTRMFYFCRHPLIYARVPTMMEDFYLWEDFFIPRLQAGYMPPECRHCGVRSLLTKWTQEARIEPGMEHVFASCTDTQQKYCIDGLLDQEIRDWASRESESLADQAQERTAELALYLERTPTPPKTMGYIEFAPDVTFYGPCKRVVPRSDQKRHSV